MAERESELRMIAWELTSSCNLKCLHCRASAESERDPDELTLKECEAIIDSISEFSSPTIILTGGEPLLRHDLMDLIEYGKRKKLRMVLATNGTLVTDEVTRSLKALGIKRVSLSIDGKDRESHERIRGVLGSFDYVISAARIFKDHGIPFQINTTITSLNSAEIESIYELSKSLGACAWHPFLLVPVGRGKDIYSDMDPKEYDKVLYRIYGLQKRGEIEIKVTCGPQYYRIMKENGDEVLSSGCLAGKAFMFISSKGFAKPCGYLDVISGDVKKDGVQRVWRESEVFLKLRDPKNLKGGCRSCSYVEVCGGCRARAYEISGDYLGQDPLCSIS